MKEYIAFDSHKQYTLAEREDIASGKWKQCRIVHGPGSITGYLQQCEEGTPVAVEVTANWYWIVDEIEAAGLEPKLVHPRKAKLMMGMINKTDSLDVHGLNRLQRNGTLPTVWIPPGELRDLRELTRGRMAVAQTRTKLKNRITATLSKYGWPVTGVTDAYGKKGRVLLNQQLKHLPMQACYMTQLLLDQLDLVQQQIDQMEDKLEALVKQTSEMQLLKTIPGIGTILSTVAALEIGDVSRFPSAGHLASYAGTTPRVHASGDKVRYGRLRPDVNRYLKWAYVEAANVGALNHKRHPERHISQLYCRIRQRRNGAKAIGAVARHLAEASFHVLTRKEAYRDPALNRGQARKV